MAYIDLYELAQNQDFRKKVKISIMNAAGNVSTEAIDPENNPIYYQKRAIHATSILNSPDIWVDPYSFGCASRGTLSEASTDSDIQFTVNAIFSAMAGVSSSELPPIVIP